MTAAKAYVAAATAFLGFIASKQVELGWGWEAAILASIAGVSVYFTSNRA